MELGETRRKGGGDVHLLLDKWFAFAGAGQGENSGQKGP